MRWSIAGILLLLFIGQLPGHTAEGNPVREERRRQLPVDRLIPRLESAKMEAEKQPDRVLSVFGVKAGESVADIGAGTGFFTFRIAERVGDRGKVFAVEVEDKLLAFMNEKIQQQQIKNVVLVKSSDFGLNLAPASCDKILMAGSYYYVADIPPFMDTIRKALKPGGLLAVIGVDADKIRKQAPTPPEKTGPANEVADVIARLQRAGFTLRASHDFLINRFFLIFGVD